MIHRSVLLAILVLLPTVTQAQQQPASSAQPSKPNVLLICVDDLKPVLGCYVDSAAKTPNIDRLASRGTRFSSAYCNQAVCSPSRNALLTSLRPQTLGIYDLPTHFRKSKPDALTIGQLFRQSGYKTQALGKVFHVGHGNTEDQASWDVPHFKPKGGSYALDSSKPTAADAKKSGDDAKGPPTEMADVEDNAYADGIVAEEAIRRLTEASQSKQPFFIAVGFIKPHLPFVAPKKYWDMHDPNKLPQPTLHSAPEGAPSYAPQFGGELRNYRGMPASPSPIDAETTKHLIHGYYSAASYMDAQVGKLLDTLDQLKLAQNTIVVLWGDHGWHLGDHGMWCKHTNYEQATRIPLIISVPGKKASVSTSLVETVDIYPTLAQLAGLQAPEGIDGRSFKSVFDNPTAKHRDHAIQVYPRGNRLGRSIRTERYRLVEWKTIGDAADTAELELYDYQADPLESRNLASEQPAVVEQLRSLLSKHPEAKPQIKVDKADESPAKKSGSQDRNVMFDKRDKNKDGMLTFDEFMSGQPDPEAAKLRFPKFDKNQDKQLSRDEFVNSGK
ncbi:MAG: sulfatase-like hydrolase/transferase [Pirellulales bacterium]